VTVVRKSLFESKELEIGLFEARDVREACGDVERQSLNVVVLPLAGVFSRHDGPGRYVVGTPSHAVLIAADTAYRIGYPGALGDRALTLRVGEEAALDRLGRNGVTGSAASHGLLAARTMMMRNQLLARLAGDGADRFAVEALGLDLLDGSLSAMRGARVPVRRSALARRARALERVKEAVAAAPGDRWSVAKLARLANLSSFHLCRIFREMAGTSLYDYVVRERLAQALDCVLDSDAGLTSIALDAGFASHSHFTARFRAFFGCTPAALRSSATGAQAREVRRRRALIRARS
jgi:AraC-like DNA-binding protein